MDSTTENENRRRFDKNWLLVIGPAMGLLLAVVLQANGLNSKAAACAGITLLCGVWWVSEVIPLAGTALIPFAAFPLLGLLPHREVAKAYGHTLILLMLTGSMISMAMERSGAHRRVAIGMVHLVGGGGSRRLVLGFLIASAVLSMWISNTATVVMLIPVALAVLEGTKNRSQLSIPLMLAVAYGAAVGGSGTKIGTPPNLLMVDSYFNATGRTIGFLDWMRIGLPAVCVMLPVVWFWLVRHLEHDSHAVELPDLGKWRPAESRVLIVFFCTALAWITREAPWGGWGELLGVANYAGDSSVAITAAIALFVLPSGEKDNRRLLDWNTANCVPWGVFIMIGGGIAIGMGFVESDLSAVMGDKLSPLAELPPFGMIFVLVGLAIFFTEVASNTAVANMLMPVMAALGTAAKMDPLLIMLPVTLGLNWAFMLPAATAPNAIIFGTGEVPIGRMVREGFVLNLIGMVLVTLVCYWLLG
jgi:sodium-dependent dicarboxylate transporter 2/3/5